MKVYLDYAATTPVRREVIEAMAPYWQEKFGNPSSIHSWGREARVAVEEARKKIAQVLNCEPEEIVFTGTTTTSDNLAILGAARGAESKGRHLITSAIEHHGVFDAFKHLEKEGFELTILPVDKDGLVDPGVVEKALRPETVLVSVMYANNEVGTIEPIKQIGKLVSWVNKLRVTSYELPIYFHTDAAAAAEYLPLDVKKLGVDLLTLGAHKFGGPKGIGLLYLRKGMRLGPLTFGGHHERGLWPGTESVPLIVGMAKALELAVQEREKTVKKVTDLRERLIKGVLTRIRGAVLTGHPKLRLPHIASFLIPGIEAEAALLLLDEAGIAASSGSACTSGSLEPSHVLLAMGYTPFAAHGSIRFSLGKETSQEDIDYVLKVLPGIVEKLRKIAPKGLISKS
jgi:cysteine desulfurase